MKRVLPLSTAPSGLQSFLADPSCEKTWEAFGSHLTAPGINGDIRPGNSKRQLLSELRAVQHGLCAYCEIALVDGDSQIEHVIPKKGPHGDSEKELDYRNLVACCQGNTSVVFGPRAVRPDADRVLPPNPENLCCGQRKGDNSAATFFDPRELPALPSLFRVSESGKLIPNEAIWGLSPYSMEYVATHIEELGLNSKRLKNARAKIYQELLESFAAFDEQSSADRDSSILRLAEQQLLPGPNGETSPFFTTSRSFFAEISEKILEPQPQLWV
jgi:uncharacterized protein (TIGR02646 family)